MQLFGWRLKKNCLGGDGDEKKCKMGKRKSVLLCSRRMITDTFQDSIKCKNKNLSVCKHQQVCSIISNRSNQVAHVTYFYVRRPTKWENSYSSTKREKMKDPRTELWGHNVMLIPSNGICCLTVWYTATSLDTLADVCMFSSIVVKRKEWRRKQYEVTAMLELADLKYFPGFLGIQVKKKKKRQDKSQHAVLSSSSSSSSGEVLM